MNLDERRIYYKEINYEDKFYIGKSITPIIDLYNKEEEHINKTGTTYNFLLSRIETLTSIINNDEVFDMANRTLLFKAPDKQLNRETHTLCGKSRTYRSTDHYPPNKQQPSASYGILNYLLPLRGLPHIVLLDNEKNMIKDLPQWNGLADKPYLYIY